MKANHLRKWHRIALAIILFLGLVLFIAPRAGRWYIVRNSGELVGRKLAIGQLRFNYFTGTLKVNDLKLYEEDGKSVFVSFKRLMINFNYIPLFKNEIFVKYVILDDPWVQVIQNSDRFNFSDMTEGDSTIAETDTVPSKPLKYIINNIAISRGFVQYTDAVLDHSISMNRVDLNIPGFTWNSDSTRLGVDFRFVDGGRLFSSLSLNQADSTFAVSLRLDSLNLDIIEPYVENSLYISAIHGYLSNDIRILGDMRSLLKMSISGMNHIYAFRLIDTLNRPILTFDDLAVDVDTLLVETSRLSVNSVSLKNPYVLFELIDTTNNWLTLMKPAVSEPSDSLKQEPDSAASQSTGSFRFKGMFLTGGKVEISDKTLRYPFGYSIENVSVSSKPDSKMPGWVDVSMSAILNGTGSFRTDFAMNPLNSADLDVKVSVEQFRMKDVEPYFMHYFGFPVTGGRMNFNTENRLRSNSLVSNNSLYFRKFTLGKKTGEKTEYNIPLKLALGVLSDKDGIIDLKSPVEMKGEEVKVGNIRKIIFRTIGNLFIKAALSPVNMIADLFKVDAEKLKEIELPLTGSSPDTRNLEKIDIVAGILNKKPGLDLDLIYCLNREKTSDSLAYILALREYRQNTATGDAVPDSVLIKFLSGRMTPDTAVQRSGLAALCRAYIGNERLNSGIDSLQIAQTEYLRNYLIRDRQVPATRFSITGTAPDTIKYDKPFPSFMMNFEAAEGDEGAPETP
jgi:hypothetical protein